MWTSTGTLLARKAFGVDAPETPSGWQEVLFDSPVPVAANVTYVASYHTNVGHYSASGGYFSTLGTDRPPLHAPPSGAVAGNGVFLYGPTAFPTDTFNATNYWVDVVFSSVADTTAPMIGDVSATAVDSSHRGRHVDDRRARHVPRRLRDRWHVPGCADSSPCRTRPLSRRTACG